MANGKATVHTMLVRLATKMDGVEEEVARMRANMDDLSVQTTQVTTKLDTLVAVAAPQREAMIRALEEVRDKVAALSGLPQDVAALQVRVSVHEGWKNKVIGGAAVVGSTGGIIAGMLSAKVRNILGL